MARKAFPFLLLLGLVGCGDAVTDGVFEDAILQTNDAPMAAGGRPNVQYWTPSRADVARAMPSIKAFLRRQDQTKALRLGDYRCQYIGIIVDGKKRIYCNFFHRKTESVDDWRNRIVEVWDGGDWYFQLEYDLQTRQCLRLVVNGEA